MGKQRLPASTINKRPGIPAYACQQLPTLPASPVQVDVTARSREGTAVKGVITPPVQS